MNRKGESLIIKNLKAIADARRGGAIVSWRSTTLSESVLAPGARVAHHASLRSCEVGRFTSVGRFAKLAYADLGAFCSISWDVTIGAISHPTTHITTHAFPYVPELGISIEPRGQEVDRVLIGHDVWIGTQAIIMPGVRVGNGAVIGAGSVVTTDVSPYTIVAGVPAKPLRARFSPEVANAIDSTEWWTWPVERLRRAMPAFRTDDVRSALQILDSSAEDSN